MARKILSTLILAGLVALPSWASAELNVKNSDGVAYVSGGFGKEERNALKAMTDFNLRITTSIQGGHLVSGTQVQIEDAKGNVVLDTLADGPVLLAKVQPGTYQVTCTHQGKSVTHTARVGQTQQQLNFAWNTSSDSPSYAGKNGRSTVAGDEPQK